MANDPLRSGTYPAASQATLEVFQALQQPDWLWEFEIPFIREKINRSFEQLDHGDEYAYYDQAVSCSGLGHRCENTGPSRFTGLKSASPEAKEVSVPIPIDQLVQEFLINGYVVFEDFIPS